MDETVVFFFFALSLRSCYVSAGTAANDETIWIADW